MSELGDRSAASSGWTCMWVNEVEPSRINDYFHALEHEVVPIYEKHGVKLLGAWRGGLGLPRHNVLLLVEYGSLEVYNALYSDPEYYEMDTRADFSSMRRNTGWMLQPLELMQRIGTTHQDATGASSQTEARP